MNSKVTGTIDGNGKAVAPKTDKKEPLVKVNRDNYQTTRSATGAKSLNNGDEVAVALNGIPIGELGAIGTKFVGEDVVAKYAHLNVGMQRMNIGNRIRGHVKKIDAANAKLVAEKKEPGKPGIEQLKVLTNPVQAKVKQATDKAAADKAQAKTDAKKKDEKKAA